MRILVLAWKFTPFVGGVEIVARQLAEGLASRGHDVLVVTSSPGAGITTSVPVIIADEMAVGAKADACLFRQFLSDTLDAFGPNVVLSHQLTYPLSPSASVAFLNLLAERRIPVVDVAHNAHRLDPALSKELLAHRLHGVVAVSNFVAERIRRLGFEGKLAVIKNCVDPNGFSPRQIDRARNRARLQLKPDDFVVLFPSRVLDLDGTLSVAKRADIAIEAFAIVSRKHRNAKLIVPAGASDRCRVTEIVKTISRSAGARRGSVKVTPFGTPKPVMPGLYCMADAVLVPSEEGFGLVTCEAMAAAKPVIATSAGASREVLAGSGLISADRPLSSLPARLAQSMTDILTAAPRKKMSLGAVSRLRVVLDFSYNLWIDRFERFLLEATP